MNFNQIVEKALDEKLYVIVSGIHGDEPAGNLAAYHFKNHSNVLVFSNMCLNAFG